MFATTATGAFATLVMCSRKVPGVLLPHWPAMDLVSTVQFVGPVGCGFCRTTELWTAVFLSPPKGQSWCHQHSSSTTNKNDKQNRFPTTNAAATD